MTIHTTDRTPVLTWDDSEYYVDYKEWKKNMMEDYGYKVFQKGDIYDPDLDANQLTEAWWQDDLQKWQDDDWKNLLVELGNLLTECNPDGMWWHIQGHNMGWRHRRGEKVVKPDYGNNTREYDRKVHYAQAFLLDVMPNTDYTLQCYRATREDGRKGIEFVVSHHDAMGEQYFCYPMTEEEMNEEDE